MAELNEEKITKIVGDAVDKLARAMSKSFDELKKESVKEHSKIALAMSKNFDEHGRATDKKLGEIKASVDNLTTSVDALASDTKTVSMEQTSTTGRVERHEKWIEELAGVSGVELKY